MSKILKTSKLSTVKKVVHTIKLKCIPLCAFLILGAVCQKVHAESKVKLSAGADLVSTYVWRGAYSAGSSFQPTIGASLGGLTVSAWGSTDFAGTAKEFDLSAAYALGNFTLGFTDYWWEGQGAKYFHYKDSHYYEASIAYNFGESLPLSLKWSTFLGGKDKDASDKALYSSYVEAAYSFTISDYACSAGIGVTPWKGYYADKANVTDISLKVSKGIKISESLTLPFYIQGILAPATDDAFLVAGITF